MSWTPEQEKALHLTPKNRLLSAAAGSGKTAVLTERILRLVEDPARRTDVSDLLVLTFTRAAAAEMKSRITGKLMKALDEEEQKPQPDAARLSHLQRQVSLMGSADITTLDAFFQNLIGEYGYLLGLPQKMRLVADPAELDLLAWRVLDEVLEKEYVKQDPAFVRLVRFTQRRYQDDPLRKMILSLYHFSQSSPFPERWLKSLPQKAAIPANASHLDDIPWMQEVLTALLSDFQSILDRFTPIADILQHNADARDVYENTLQKDKENVQDLMAAKSWEDLREKLAGFSWSRMPSVNKNIMAAHPELTTEVKDEIQKLLNTVKQKLTPMMIPFFGKDDKKSPFGWKRMETQWIQEARSSQEMVALIARITLAFSSAFRKEKEAEGVMDFNDASHYALSILLDRSNPHFSIEQAEDFPSKAARSLQKRYKEILIDEYQDTNGTQDLICALLARGNNRFMVGDIRQSIYRFRQADPDIFLAKYNTYTTGHAATERIDLNTNFRSDRVILSAINYLFRRLMSGDTLEFPYGDEEAMHHGRREDPQPADYVGLYQTADVTGGKRLTEPSVSIELIVRPSKNSQADTKETADSNENQADENDTATGSSAAEELADIENITLEGRLIARQIRDMVEEKRSVTQEDGSYRPIRYSDIAILLRTTHGLIDKAAALVDILREAGIPASAAVDGSSSLDSMEVSILRDLLEILDNPRQDIPLTAVLRSIFVDLTEVDLAALYTEQKGGVLWDYLRASYGKGAALPGILPPETEKKLSGFLASYDRWHAAAWQGPAPLIKTILRETGYLTYVSGLSWGELRRQNVVDFYEAARKIEGSAGRSLYGFLHFLSSLEEQGNSLSTGSPLPSAEDAVTISTIHKAKGLEYPVVFLADTAKKFHGVEAKDFLCHKDMGMGLFYYDEPDSAKWTTLYYMAVEDRISREQLAEEARVLYVAVSRARDKLIITGTRNEKQLDQDMKKWTTPNLTPAGTSADNAALPAANVLHARSFLDWIMTAALSHPTMASLWQQAGQAQQPISDAPGDHTVFDCAILPAGSILGTAASVASFPDRRKELMDWAKAPDTAAVPARLSSQLTWTYPYASAATTPARCTATGALALLKEDKLAADNSSGHFARAAQKPSFLQASPFTSGAAYGTLMHKAMEMIDFTSLPETPGEKDIQSAISALAAAGAFTKEETDFLLAGDARKPLDQLLAFTKGSLFRRMRAAEAIHKEMPFSILLPLSRFRHLAAGDPASSDKLLMRGTMDCLLEMKEGLFIIDYKTDRFNKVEEFREHYTEQLRIYKEAAEQLFLRPVTGLALWSFELGQEIAVWGK